MATSKTTQVFAYTFESLADEMYARGDEVVDDAFHTVAQKLYDHAANSFQFDPSHAEEALEALGVAV